MMNDIMIIFDDLYGISLEIWSARIHKDLSEKSFSMRTNKFLTDEMKYKGGFFSFISVLRSEINSSGVFSI